MHFMFRKGWHCQFLEEDMKTLLPRTLTFAEHRKIWEMAKRGGFTLNIAGRQEIEEALRKGVGGNLAGSHARAIREAAGHRTRAAMTTAIIEPLPTSAE